jgi:hypothetical protein
MANSLDGDRKSTAKGDQIEEPQAPIGGFDAIGARFDSTIAYGGLRKTR